MQATRTNKRVSKMMHHTLAKDLEVTKRSGQRINFVFLSLWLDVETNQTIDYCISLVREVLVDWSIDKILADEFDALIEVVFTSNSKNPMATVANRLKSSLAGQGQDRLYDGAIRGMEGKAEVRSKTAISHAIEDNADRIANGIVRYIHYPNCFIELTDQDGEVITFSRQFTIGRTSVNNDVMVNDPNVSSKHVVISIDRDGNWLLFDAGSKNGTKVNGDLVRETQLTVNDCIEISVGKTFTITNIGTLQPPYLPSNVNHRSINATKTIDTLTVPRTGQGFEDVEAHKDTEKLEERQSPQRIDQISAASDVEEEETHRIEGRHHKAKHFRKTEVAE